MNTSSSGRRATVSALGALLIIMLASCAQDTIYTGTPRTTASHNETPISTNFPTTLQPKLQAGQHWLAIADDTGRAVVAGLRGGRFCPPKPGACSTVFVRPTEVVTGFSRALHNQLITTLVKEGIVVSKAPETALVVDIDVQPVLFSPNRPQYRHAGVPVELAPGVWALRDVAATDPANQGMTPPAPDALHWFRSQFAAGQTPRAEILVTVSIGDRNRYLSRTSSAYYVADTDQRLYDEELCSLFKLCPGDRKNACDCPGVATARGTCGCTLAKVVKVVGDCPLDQPCPVEPVVATAAEKSATAGTKVKK